MRFMLIVKATGDCEAGKLPSEELMAEMAKFNEEMAKAGVLIDALGLQPTSKAARVKFSGSRRIVTDGPFTETKDLIGGFWLIRADSLEEAIEWAKRSPNPHPGEESEIEVRQAFELEDFAPGEAVERERELQGRLAKAEG